MDKGLKDYLDSKFEGNNLSTWSKYWESSKDLPAKLAKKFLSPPPTSTAKVRLFSSAINIADGGVRLLPEKLERLLFLRENSMMQNISIESLYLF